MAAVVVEIPSLIYLAVQIREQTKERRQAAVPALTVQWGDLIESLRDNAETAAIFLRGNLRLNLQRDILGFAGCFVDDDKVTAIVATELFVGVQKLDAIDRTIWGNVHVE